MPNNQVFCLGVEEFARQFSGLEADTIIADPPYFMQLPKRVLKRHEGSEVRGINEVDWDMGWAGPDAYQDWVFDWMTVLKENRVMKDNANVLIFMGSNSLGELLVAARRAGYYRRTNLHWHKPNSMPNFLGVAPKNDIEYIINFKPYQKSRAPFYNKAAAKVMSPSTGEQVNMGTVITFPSLSFNTKERVKSDSGDTAHKTQKPLELISFLLSIYHPEGGVVIDAFGGTGTTSVAARLIGSDSVYFDNNTAYAALAMDRILKCQERQ